jgi:hypothetical protein
VSLIWETHEGQWRFDSKNEVVTIFAAGDNVPLGVGDFDGVWEVEGRDVFDAGRFTFFAVEIGRNGKRKAKEEGETLRTHCYLNSHLANALITM